VIAEATTGDLSASSSKPVGALGGCWPAPTIPSGYPPTRLVTAPLQPGSSSGDERGPRARNQRAVSRPRTRPKRFTFEVINEAEESRLVFLAVRAALRGTAALEGRLALVCRGSAGGSTEPDGCCGAAERSAGRGLGDHEPDGAGTHIQHRDQSDRGPFIGRHPAVLRVCTRGDRT